MAYKNVKTEHAFQVFHRDLKEDNFPPVIFMYGEEEYLIQWACKSLADKFTDSGMRSMDFVKLGEEESVDDILSACDTFSVFSSKRIIWACDFPPLFKKNSKGFGEREIEKILNYIKNPNPETILIFSCAEPDEKSAFVKELKKQCRVYPFDKLDRPQLTAFAEKRFKSAGINIDRSTLRYLVDETGYFNRETDYRIFNLENDIKKVIAYSDGHKITEEDIDATVHGELDKFIFDFLDAVTAGRKDKALRMFNNILGDGGEAYSILGLLVNQFELMLEAKELYEAAKDRQEVVNALKVNGYRVKKALSFAEKFSADRLKEILSQLYEIDRNIKTGLMEQNLALELLIGRI